MEKKNRSFYTTMGGIGSLPMVMKSEEVFSVEDLYDFFCASEIWQIGVQTNSSKNVGKRKGKK